MHRYIWLPALALALALPLAFSWAGSPPKQTETTECGEHGTTVQFEDSPAEAAKKAAKAEKLVFVLHVSGHFEDPGLT